MSERTQLLSPAPKVELIKWPQVDPNHPDREILNQLVVAAGESARSCYSSRLCRPEDYLNEKHRQVTDEVIDSTRESGHLTTRQHDHLEFGLSGVSRQLIWSFLHAHPFYNSDQVSQRYVTMKEGNFLVPYLEGRNLELYLQTVGMQMEAYKKLGEMLQPVATDAYFDIFKGRKSKAEEYKGEIVKKTQEVARYVLPVATHAHLYHTVSTLTLMRMVRACWSGDVPIETKMVVDAMVKEVVGKTGESFLRELSDPIPLEETSEYQTLVSLRKEVDFAEAARFVSEFDEDQEGKTAKLVGWTTGPEMVLGKAVRSALGVSRGRLSDQEAVMVLMNPGRSHNFGLGETLNMTTFSKLSRAMESVSFTFTQRLSHTADSQDQRHRMTPAARPFLVAQYHGEPDFETPLLIQSIPQAKEYYQQVMIDSFTAIKALLERGVSFENASYLLPNGMTIRYTEQGSLLNWHHKLRMRLCFNAQEEIFRAAVDVANQIKEVAPNVGRELFPPCTLRKAGMVTPFCPEGKRFCGVPVWALSRDQYKRLI